MKRPFGRGTSEQPQIWGLTNQKLIATYKAWDDPPSIAVVGTASQRVYVEVSVPNGLELLSLTLPKKIPKNVDVNSWLVGGLNQPI